MKYIQKIMILAVVILSISFSQNNNLSGKINFNNGETVEFSSLVWIQSTGLENRYQSTEYGLMVGIEGNWSIFEYDKIKSIEVVSYKVSRDILGTINNAQIEIETKKGKIFRTLLSSLSQIVVNTTDWKTNKDTQVKYPFSEKGELNIKSIEFDK